MRNPDGKTHAGNNRPHHSTQSTGQLLVIPHKSRSSTCLNCNNRWIVTTKKVHLTEERCTRETRKSRRLLLSPSPLEQLEKLQ